MSAITDLLHEVYRQGSSDGHPLNHAHGIEDEVAEATREEELIFKRGFDAGIEFQKKTETPKAKQYRLEAIAARAELANLRARVNAVVMGLLNADAPRPVETAISKLQDALAEVFL